MITELIEHKQRYGNCVVLRRHSKKLHVWAANLRSDRSLQPYKVKCLNDLGFVWDVEKFQWEEGFRYLVAYQEEFGDCLVRKGYATQDFKLAVWVSTQRSNRANQLTPEQIKRLNNLGFVWEVREYYWEEGFNYLVAYKEEFGDCLVMKGCVIQGYRLAVWVSTQRSNRANQLTPEQIKRLNDLGFVWNVLEYNWDQGYEHLVAYKEEFGDCLMSSKTKYNGYKLGGWLATQRQYKEKLNPERVDRLNALGVVWKGN
jgi:hypothetical protein